MVANHHRREDRRSEHTLLGLPCNNNSNNSTTMHHLLSSTTTNIRKIMAMVAATMNMGAAMIKVMEDKIKDTADNMTTGIISEALRLKVTLSKTTILDPMAAMDPLLDLLLPVPVAVEVDRLCKEAELGRPVRCVLLQTTAEVLRLPIHRAVAATLRDQDGVIRPKAPAGDLVLPIEL